MVSQRKLLWGGREAWVRGEGGMDGGLGEEGRDGGLGEERREGGLG